jgi:hypothetical protein
MRTLTLGGMKGFKTYYRSHKDGEVSELLIAATSKTAALKAARLHAKNYNLRFIGFASDFGE